LFWIELIAALAALLALVSLHGERRRTAYVKARLSAGAGTLPPATVIVPVKGEDQGLRENLAALAALDYPNYELIVVAQCAADIPSGVLPRRVKVVLAHGGSPEASEKVQNLTAAVFAARHSSTMYAFADSDGRVIPGWLRALAAPLEEPGVGASTGFRWFMPEPAGLWSLLRAVWDGASLGVLGPGDNPFVWGGAMAIRKEVLFAVGILDAWKTAVSDDYALSDAVHRAGLRIAFAPVALVPSLEPITAQRFFAWARRQMLLTRVYSPKLWRGALTAHVVYCCGMVAAVAGWLHGSTAATYLLAAQLLPGMAKGLGRARVARAALPSHTAWFRRWGWTHGLLVPIATWLWLGVLLSSAFGASIEWRGRRYRLRRSSGKRDSAGG
jgi:cellulose synthase/poly-beta-1,6-N-acetylglucosamine synthase-like glycosyltransferase